MEGVTLIASLSNTRTDSTTIWMLQSNGSGQLHYERTVRFTQLLPNALVPLSKTRVSEMVGCFLFLNRVARECCVVARDARPVLLVVRLRMARRNELICHSENRAAEPNRVALHRVRHDANIELHLLSSARERGGAEGVSDVHSARGGDEGSRACPADRPPSSRARAPRPRGRVSRLRARSRENGRESGAARRTTSTMGEKNALCP